jgi:maleylacetoacetate isomerase
MIKLYTYFRSTAAYRVRIALNLKNIEHELISVNLLGGEEQQAPFTEINPQKLLPVLDHDGRILYQSMAILEYLEEKYAEPALLPADSVARAEVRALANVIACDIHPLNNLRVLKYLGGTLEVDEEARLAWYHQWLREGFDAFETRLASTSNGQFCLGDEPGLADVMLIPQVYNAFRFDFDMTPYPKISSINLHCLKLEAFSRAAPENQPDAT